jgi:hypothetical protein
VDVRGAQLERLEQQHVDQLDDRGLVGIEQVLRLLDVLGDADDVGVLDILQRFVDAVGLVAIGAIDQVGDLATAREHGLDFAPEQRREVVHRLHVERPVGGHTQQRARVFDGDQPVRARELHRDLLDEHGRHARAVETHAELEPEQFPEELQALAFRQHVLADQDWSSCWPVSRSVRSASSICGCVSPRAAAGLRGCGPGRSSDWQHSGWSTRSFLAGSVRVARCDRRRGARLPVPDVPAALASGRPAVGRHLVLALGVEVLDRGAHVLQRAGLRRGAARPLAVDDAQRARRCSPAPRVCASGSRIQVLEVVFVEDRRA